jgi:NADPH:quinone reductase-like Zn-dependent oxidoreductase
MIEHSTLSPMAYIIPKTMKAMLAHKYGGPEVFQLSEVPTPIPKANEVLVKVLYKNMYKRD